MALAERGWWADAAFALCAVPQADLEPRRRHACRLALPRDGGPFIPTRYFREQDVGLWLSWIGQDAEDRPTQGVNGQLVAATFTRVTARFGEYASGRQGGDGRPSGIGGNPDDAPLPLYVCTCPPGRDPSTPSSSSWWPTTSRGWSDLLEGVRQLQAVHVAGGGLLALPRRSRAHTLVEAATRISARGTVALGAFLFHEAEPFLEAGDDSSGLAQFHLNVARLYHTAAEVGRDPPLRMPRTRAAEEQAAGELARARERADYWSREAAAGRPAKLAWMRRVLVLTPSQLPSPASSPSSLHFGLARDYYRRARGLFAEMNTKSLASLLEYTTALATILAEHPRGAHDLREADRLFAEMVGAPVPKARRKDQGNKDAQGGNWGGADPPSLRHRQGCMLVAGARNRLHGLDRPAEALEWLDRALQVCPDRIDLTSEPLLDLYCECAERSGAAPGQLLRHLRRIPDHRRTPPVLLAMAEATRRTGKGEGKVRPLLLEFQARLPAYLSRRTGLVAADELLRTVAGWRHRAMGLVEG